MFAVFVDLHIRPGQMDAFLPLMLENAAASRDEPGCDTFDVAVDATDPNLILLYETYTDEQAFAAHLQTAHFKSFDAASAPMIADKTIRTGLVQT